MKRYPIGIMIRCDEGVDLRHEIQKAKELELDSCQLCIWDAARFRDAAYAAYVKEVLEETAFPVTGLWDQKVLLPFSGTQTLLPTIFQIRFLLFQRGFCDSPDTPFFFSAHIPDTPEGQ